jgi:hypothetical protein
MFRKGQSRVLHETCTYMNGRAMEKLARPANERNLLVFYTPLSLFSHLLVLALCDSPSLGVGTRGVTCPPLLSAKKSSM